MTLANSLVTASLFPLRYKQGRTWKSTCDGSLIFLQETSSYLTNTRSRLTRVVLPNQSVIRKIMGAFTSYFPGNIIVSVPWIGKFYVSRMLPTKKQRASVVRQRSFVPAPHHSIELRDPTRVNIRKTHSLVVSVPCQKAWIRESPISGVVYLRDCFSCPHGSDWLTGTAGGAVPNNRA